MMSFPWIARRSLARSCVSASFRRFKSIAVTSTYNQRVDAFPSLIIGPNRTIEPLGSFAEAQAQVGACTYKQVVPPTMFHSHPF